MAQKTKQEAGVAVCAQPNENILRAARASWYFVKRGAAMVPLSKTKAPAEKYRNRFRTQPHWPMEWATNPRHKDSAGLGLLTGKVNEVTVLDDDAGGEAVAALFEILGLEIPHTTVAKTGGGGRHFYFQHEPRLKGWVKVLGIDVRNDGGIVVLPGSLHPTTGRRYEWIAPPEEAGFAEIPDEAVRAILDAAGAKRQSSGEVSNCPPGCQSGTVVSSGYELPERVLKGMRNDMLFRLACSLRARAVPEDQACRLVGEANGERCEPPLREPELALLLKSAYSYDEGLSDGWKPAGSKVREALIENPWSAVDEMLLLDHRPNLNAVLSVLRAWAELRHPVAFAHEPLERALKEQCSLELDRDQRQYCLQELDRLGFILRPDERMMEIKGWNDGCYEIRVARPPSEEKA